MLSVQLLLGLVIFVEYMRQYKKRPWSLAHGDIHANLVAFAAEPPPVSADPVTTSIHALMVATGGPDGELVRGVSLFRDVSFSTDTVEWAHKPATHIVRRHKQLGAASLHLRSHISSVGVILRQPKQKKKIATLRARLQKTLTKQPNRIRGRQAYMGQLQRLSGARRRAGLDPTNSENVSTTITARHGRLYSRMGVAEKAVYEQLAEDERHHAFGEMYEKADMVREKIAKLELGMVSARTDAPICRLGSCRLDGGQMERFADMLDNSSFDRSTLAAERLELVEPRGEPADTIQDIFESIPVADRDGRGAKHEFYMAWFAHYRDALASSILKLVDELNFSVVLLRFVYAVQTPLRVCFKPVTEIAPYYDDTDDDFGGGLGPVVHCFALSSDLDFVYSDEGDMFHLPGKISHVLLESVWRNGVLCSPQEWISLPELLLRLPHPLFAGGSQADVEPVVVDRAARRPLPPFLQEHVPEYSEWCLDDSLLHEISSSEDSSVSSSSFDMKTPAKKPKFEGEDEIIELALAAARLAFAHLPRVTNFTVDVRGGKSTYMKYGTAADYLRAEANSGTPSIFCKKFKLNQSFSCKLGTYTDEDVGALCEGWASKMQTLFDVWRNHGFAADFRFLPHHEAWHEPISFQNVATRALPSCLAKVRQVRGIRPKNP